MPQRSSRSKVPVGVADGDPLPSKPGTMPKRGTAASPLQTAPDVDPDDTGNTTPVPRRSTRKHTRSVASVEGQEVIMEVGTRLPGRKRARLAAIAESQEPVDQDVFMVTDRVDTPSINPSLLMRISSVPPSDDGTVVDTANAENFLDLEADEDDAAAGSDVADGKDNDTTMADFIVPSSEDNTEEDSDVPIVKHSSKVAHRYGGDASIERARKVGKVQTGSVDQVSDSPPPQYQSLSSIPEDAMVTPPPRHRQGLASSVSTSSKSKGVDTPVINRVNRLNFNQDAVDKVSTLTRSYFNAAIVTRINRLLAYKDSVSCCYSARHIPTSADFGPKLGAADDRSDYVCVGAETLTLWLVGEVSSFIHADAGGSNFPARRPAITFRPFFRSDYDAVRRMLVRTSNPRKCTTADDATQALLARRWQAPYGTKVEDVPPFSECFDGTEGWQGAVPGVDYISPSAISVNDVVLVEANVLKVIPSELVKTATREYKRKVKGQWETELELLSVALLFRAPKYAPRRKIAAVAI